MRKRRQLELLPYEPDEGFHLFWRHYPKKVAKVDALKAWAQLKPSPELVDKMLLALSWQVRQPAWQRDNGDAIPYPATYIRGKRWEDEPFHPIPKYQGAAPVDNKLKVPSHEPL